MSNCKTYISLCQIVRHILVYVNQNRVYVSTFKT
ncbi:hypothetical protein ACJIZ3_011008 [Penstemon smallii]|uniref:Uncharacterized protein n=1 Tax=Penstemon smallii TaxID=265156 RepID=A0ABD3UHX7_9LAMI